MEITKEQFEAYEGVRSSGVTNMFDVRTVEQISGLSREQIMSIMKSYGELKGKYQQSKCDRCGVEIDEEDKMDGKCMECFEGEED